MAWSTHPWGRTRPHERGLVELNTPGTASTEGSLDNQYFQSTLFNLGAKWGSGPRERAQPPCFKSKRICPSQLHTRCAATKVSLDLFRLLRRLNELSCRLSRAQGSEQDQFNTRQLAIKAHRALSQFRTPIRWDIPACPSLVEIFWARSWAENFAVTLDGRIRLNRIKQWKTRIKNSEKHGCSFIFQHLRNKSSDDPPNLVSDRAGNIITQPEQAIATLNEAWDDIFAANVLSEHPLKMLETVWPYIQDKQIPANLPPITGDALFLTVQKRKINAAPGLDGWRTCELQALPKFCFNVLAEFFQLIEESEFPLPTALTVAKQVILNKAGPASPINKRLITVLPPLLLAYTGTRYAQLQEWQITAMPPAIVGGVKGRYMATLYDDLRLDLDLANQAGETIVGVKLDKSKAFDRIIPQFAACLFVAFGIPKHVVRVFLLLYQNLHKHMAYRNWTSPCATTHANGMAQGCSFSILAMNAYNKVWYHFLELFPALVVRAYIDDSYIWCKLTHAAMLQQAIQVTQTWDTLVGQRLNTGKSSMWSNTGHGRGALAELFPEFPVVLEFETLGTRMYTSSRENFGFTDGSFKKILMDIDHVAALPVSMKTKIFLIGAKVVPKITFGSHISRIPKAKLETIQNAIARCMWGKRPKWRSKWLLHAVLAYPHRTDPRSACAYTTVFETIRACHSDATIFHKFEKSFMHHSWPAHSLSSRFQQACEFLGIQIHQGLKLSFKGSCPIPLTDLPPQDVRKMLQAITRNACYNLAGSTPRKDFSKTNDVFDLSLTASTFRSDRVLTTEAIANHQRFESIVVGCTLTNDRMASTGWSESAKCRFCDHEKESMAHLVFDCPRIGDIIGTPVVHEMGVNFGILGHVHHPSFIARRRLLQNDPNALQIPDVFHPDTIVEIWTDGSVVFGENIWLATGAFAVVDDRRNIIYKGQVNHWSMSAYAAELWAVLFSCSQATTGLRIFSDCKTE